MFLKKIFKNDFSKYVFTLMVGTGIAQLIPILISPVLTRLYAPEFFGVFALFVAITTTLSSIANGRYDLAIVLPENKEDAYNLLSLGFLISIIFSILLFILIYVFCEEIIFLLKNNEIRDWLFFVPISVFLISLFSLLNYFNTREKKYIDIRNANIIRSIVLAIIQISMGLLKPGVGGLIFGQIISQMIALRRLFLNTLNNNYIKLISFCSMKRVAIQYKDYPLYSTWSSLLNSASTQIPVIMLTSFYGLKVAGFYALALRIIASPMSIIGSSFSQVFYQRSCEVKNNRKELAELTYSTYRKLLQISIIPFSILIASSDIVFGFIFGKEWREAGEYVQVLSLWFLFVFISSPLSMLLMTLEKQKQNLYFNIIMFLSRILVIFIGGLLFYNAYYTIIIYSVIGVLFWFIFCIYLLKLVKIPILLILSLTLRYLFIIGVLVIVMRYFLINLGLVE